jgi:hypothetical protein
MHSQTLDSVEFNGLTETESESNQPVENPHQSSKYYEDTINLSTICYDKLRLDFDSVSGKSLDLSTLRSDKLAIIIDPRFDKLMENVIKNFMFFMRPQGWNLMVISHPIYENIIREIFPYCIFGKIEDDLIYFNENNIPNLTINTYNRILLSTYFWNSLPGEHIAIFQKDCIMYKMFDDIFLTYDFAGANTYLPKVQSIFNGMMNGGFSLRKKSTMIECLTKINCNIINNYINIMKQLLSSPTNENAHEFNGLKETETKSSLNLSERNVDEFENHRTFEERDAIKCSPEWNEGECQVEEWNMENMNEDIFFTFACEILQKKMPDMEHRKRLSIEFEESIYFNIVPNENNIPAVYHGWNKNYHSIDAAKYFMSFSPYFRQSIEIDCRSSNEREQK